jgi:hypothetical protein
MKIKCIYWLKTEKNTDIFVFVFPGSSVFASIPSASQDSGLPQDSGQGR